MCGTSLAPNPGIIDSLNDGPPAKAASHSGSHLEASMKRSMLISALVGALGAGVAFAGGPAEQGGRGSAATAQKARGGGPDQSAGHTTPKPQPGTEASPAAPEGQVALGSVHIPKAVKADGKPLSAGTYTVRLTPQTASPDAKGQTAALERWVEFMKGGKVAGREVVTIVPQSEISKVQKDTPPKPNGAKVETLKGGDYVRVWINKGGNHYLLHLPTSA